MTSASATPTLITQRLQSIDALRGLVILFMLLDHVRETFLLHRQVSDPMASTPRNRRFSSAAPSLTCVRLCSSC